MYGKAYCMHGLCMWTSALDWSSEWSQAIQRGCALPNGDAMNFEHNKRSLFACCSSENACYLGNCGLYDPQTVPWHSPRR